MKTKKLITLIIVIALIGFSSLVALNGLKLGNFNIPPVKDSIRQGLDLKGGVFVVYEANTDAKGSELEKIIDQTIEVFRRRIDSMGLTEPVIVKEGEKRIRIELPGVKNAREAIEMVGKTAQLKFMEQDGTVVLTGGQVRKSEVVFDRSTNKPVISLEFDSEGAKKFREATKELSKTNAPILIVLDDEIISSPRVTSEIPDGQAQITGDFTVESAAQLANLIRAGALPVDFDEVQTSTVTATLGENALKRSIDGAKIGITLVLIFMMIYYKIPGLVAGIGLVAYMLIILFSFVAMNATLTLPGIAALILSVGMAVDANVIIFERIKEEIRNGKSIRASIESGFSKALSTIVDSNITTFIAGIVLYYFGTGPIKGFAVTLMIGIIASMFTAIVITKMLLKTIADANITRNKKLFGA
ncbi:protein translocase subunit SecD [Alkalithermobacter paradoxus]|uniref:Protein translocase subunit SecD n=1 Tax=Alkalithermobacter paradoxus TaxID=29349 RepID=A0A1V4IA14_9FIRM|nr:protein translocase subunit SecD [[Clostridium] thermoalcaliphilum]